MARAANSRRSARAMAGPGPARDSAAPWRQPLSSGRPTPRRPRRWLLAASVVLYAAWLFFLLLLSWAGK